ncbi:MAG: hypothetical protein HY719_06285, partial [Planctomycetes bacterium]|nr:hypothetical protein [Planctomycetota bacterium]
MLDRPMASLAETLREMVGDGDAALTERDVGGPAGRVRCLACGHRCLISPGRDGVCKVRYNEEGRLKVPWGYVGALQCDPIE